MRKKIDWNYEKAMIEHSEDQKENCNSCKYSAEGLCDQCAGENFGHWTEISGEYRCENYVREEVSKNE